MLDENTRIQLRLTAMQLAVTHGKSLYDNGYDFKDDGSALSNLANDIYMYVATGKVKEDTNG